MAEKRKVRSITINVASNGYSVDCNYELKKGSEPFSYEPTKPKVFNSITEMLDHVEDELEGTKEGSREERAEGETTEKPKVRVLGHRTVRYIKKKEA